MMEKNNIKRARTNTRLPMDFAPFGVKDTECVHFKFENN